MPQVNLYETLEKEHRDLLNKIDALDQKITEVLKDWGVLAVSESIPENDHNPFLEHDNINNIPKDHNFHNNDV